MKVPEPKFPLKGYSELRKGRWSSPGYIYFITAVIKDRRQLFQIKELCQIIFNSVQWMEEQKRWECYCCMIMPEHIHIIARLEEASTLPKVMHSLKSYTANQINRFLRENGRVWQEGYHDHCIRKEESLWDIILYCYNNPIRRGLVQKPSDYPFWRSKYNLE